MKRTRAFTVQDILNSACGDLNRHLLDPEPVKKPDKSKVILKPHKKGDIKPLANNEQWLNLEGGMGFHGRDVHRMRRVGKKESGNLLDGKQYLEFPNF